MSDIGRTPNIYPDHYSAADIIADVIWTNEGTLRGTATEAAQALKDSGRLMPDLAIIRTVEELEALDPDSIVLDCTGHLMTNRDRLPAVVVATGAQVRAARKALDEAE